MNRLSYATKGRRPKNYFNVSFKKKKKKTLNLGEHGIRPTGENNIFFLHTSENTSKTGPYIKYPTPLPLI